MQKTIHSEQNITILTEDMIQPFICVTLTHLPQSNPGPGFNKTLFKK